ncbi:MAG TPA: M14-type cytosolic carboxypeptidase, partial [Polyangiaceae bacterium]|nr:M14-type cytosolic carboxypeptidase [Polyangiaceae bacterium]
MRVLSPRDGGKIQLLRAGKTEARLAIRADDRNPEFRQYFAFVARDLGGARCAFEIANAGDCTYADAFEGYRVCASADGEDWFRVPTEWGGRTLRFECEGQDAMAFAYYPPYGRARRRALVDSVRASGRGAVHDLGRTVRGETMQLLSLGRRDEAAPKLWIVAQQHPGETMAGWFMEGLVGRLASDDDDTVSRLLDESSVFLVLCMNPDGALAGNHRTNAVGTDLNRCWWEADKRISPEVLCVRDAMYEHGVDFFLDVHGDEHVPYVFVAGAEGNPQYTDRIEALEE